MSELEDDAEKLSREFLSQPLVQKYLKAKEAFEKDPRILGMKKEISAGRQNLKNLPSEERTKELLRLKALQKAYEEDSEVVSFNQLKDEVEELEKPIRDLVVF
jgi:predicted transcriptional regulator